jgi:hypothetical protein
MPRKNPNAEGLAVPLLAIERSSIGKRAKTCTPCPLPEPDERKFVENLRRRRRARQASLAR